MFLYSQTEADYVIYPTNIVQLYNLLKLTQCPCIINNNDDGGQQILWGEPLPFFNISQTRAVDPSSSDGGN